MEHHHHHEADEHSKYEAALALYETNLSDDEVKAKTAHIIEKYVAENNTLEVKKFLFNCIDLTTLKTEDSEESVLKFTERVNDFEDKYPDLKNVAAICVYPCFAKIVSQSLEVEDVNIACVSAGFPSSSSQWASSSVAITKECAMKSRKSRTSAVNVTSRPSLRQAH